MTEQRKPLWETAQSAYAAASNEAFLVSQGPRKGWDAVFCAIADAVVPDEPAEFPPRDHAEWIAWAERRKIRQRLLDAADEAGGR